MAVTSDGWRSRSSATDFCLLISSKANCSHRSPSMTFYSEYDNQINPTYCNRPIRLQNVVNLNRSVVAAIRQVIPATQWRQFRSHMHLEVLEKFVILNKHLKYNKKRGSGANSHYLTSFVVKGINDPIAPDMVAYTSASAPPGIREVFCRLTTISPI